MVTKTTRIEECPSFSGCSAPLCPLADNLEHCVFYADEPICTSRKFRQPWVRIQRRIVRRTKGNADVGYFTAKMLRSIKAVSSGIRGINPDFKASAEVWATTRKKGRQAEGQGETSVNRGRVLAHS